MFCLINHSKQGVEELFEQIIELIIRLRALRLNVPSHHYKHINVRKVNLITLLMSLGHHGITHI